MLYVLIFRQNSLDELIILILLTILASNIGINPLSGKRTSSNNNSCEVRVFLSNKREKIKITEMKRIIMLTKQIK